MKVYERKLQVHSVRDGEWKEHDTSVTSITDTHILVKVARVVSSGL